MNPSLIVTWVVWGGGARPVHSEDVTQDSPMWVLPKPQERLWPNIPRDFMFFPLIDGFQIVCRGTIKPSSISGSTYFCLSLDCELLEDRDCVSFLAVTLLPGTLQCPKCICWIAFKKAG